MNDTKNLAITLAITVVMVILWQEFYQKPRMQEYYAKLEEIEKQNQPEPDTTDISNTETIITNSIKEDKAPKIIAKKIKINSDKLSGELDLSGSVFSKLFLNKYKESKDSEKNIEILFPRNSNTPYYIGLNYLGNNNQKLTSFSNIWTSNHDILTPNSPIILNLKLDNGLNISRKISMDDNYLFTIEDKITNNSNNELDIKQFGFINRFFNPDSNKYLIVHEGPISLVNDELNEFSFADLEDEQEINLTSKNSWFGFSDKYWLSAFIPTAKSNNNINYKYYLKDGQKRYQASFVGDLNILEPGQEISFSTQLFVGAKELNLLDKYSKEYDITLFDRSVDFGVLYFLTKPIFQLLIFINDKVGNFGFSIIILTIITRILLFPLANQSFKSMAKMKKIQPEIVKLKEKFKGDKAELHQKMMKLYKEKKVNPAAGCLPILIQLPVFFALYKVLLINIEMRHAEFVGWIHDLSAPDPTSIINLFGLLPFEAGIAFGIWPCLMGFTMVLQQKFNPPVSDPIQAKVMKFMPYLFVFLFISFPAGLVIYWTCNNILSIMQQAIITKIIDKNDDDKKRNKS